MNLVIRFQMLTPLNLPKGENSDLHSQKVFLSLGGVRGGQNEELIKTI